MSFLKNKLVRNLIISIIVLGALGGAYYAVSVPEEEGETDIAAEHTPTPRITAFSTDVKNIKEVYIKNSESEYTVSQSEDACEVKGARVEYNAEKLAAHMHYFAEITAIAKLDADDESYGLSKPSAKAVVKLKNDNEVQIEIGNAVAGGTGYFARINSEIYNVPAYFANAVLKSSDTLREDVMADIDTMSMKSIRLSGKAGDIVSIRPIRADEKDKFPKTASYIMTYPKYVPVAIDYFGKLMEYVGDVTALSFVSEEKSEYGKYGLDNPELTFVFEDKNGTVTVHFGDKPDESSVYTRIEGKDTVFTQSSALYDELCKVNGENLVDPFCMLVNITEIEDVTIKNGKKTHTMSVKDEKYFIDGKESAEMPFRKTYEEIIGITQNGFAEKAGGETAYEITYRFKDGSTQTAKYLEYDERNYVLDIGGKQDFTVLKKKLSAVMEKVESLAKNPTEE